MEGDRRSLAGNLKGKTIQCLPLSLALQKGPLQNLLNQLFVNNYRCFDLNGQFRGQLAFKKPKSAKKFKDKGATDFGLMLISVFFTKRGRLACLQKTF